MRAATPLRPTRGTRCPGPCAGLCTESGFASAYTEHRPRLLGRARTVIGDAELAEDAVQEVFLRAWRACASFDPDAGPPLISWLVTIARNVVIDHARARAVRPRTSHPIDQATEPADRRTDIDDAILRSVLVDAMATVSDEHRAIVLKAVLRDRSYAEVAAELGVPVGTVKSRVFYALRGMRGALEPSELLSA